MLVSVVWLCGRPLTSFVMYLYFPVTGVITLEDVLEEVINNEITDESDQYVSNDQRERIMRDRPTDKFLTLFNHKIQERQKLTQEEVQAVIAYLPAYVPEFQSFNTKTLEHLARRAEVRHPQELMCCLMSSDNAACF